MWEWMLEKLQQLALFGRTKALPAVIILVIGIFVVRLLLKLIVSVMVKAKAETAVVKLVRAACRVILYVMLLLIVASALGIDVTGVVALASVLTLAISLSVQNTLTNVIGGFTLLSNKPFSVGDFVEIASQSGTVKEVGLTYTKLRTGDNKTVSIPNSAVVAAEIVNYTVAGTRRVEVMISVPYDAPVDKVLAALLEAAKVPTALGIPAPNAVVKNYDGGTMNCWLYLWCASSDYGTTLFSVNKRIHEIFQAEGLEITCPHIYVESDK